ncbi:adhesion G-protein coupled receptor F3 [Garra rufa]|uniref:adhesion G-protein coupled receptor F3 n=1 Tax=Garra rufa TaxID=137080 RepID=UPI003CCEB2EA
MLGYTWSEDMCKTYDCCNNNCIQKDDGTAVCLPESRVSINGFTTFNDDCSLLCDPSKKDSTLYKKKNEEFTNLLAGNYSKLKYFDSLIINSYRTGSIIVDYTVQIMGPVELTQLKDVAVSLGNSKLVTTGLINIEGPQGPVDIGSSTTITCSRQQNLGDEVKWFLIDMQNKTTEITTGKEATLNTTSSTDILELYNISGSWKGTIKCMYKDGFIEHTASTELDIALLPEIQAMSTPQFPDCRDKNLNRETEIECKISDDKETGQETVNVICTFTNDRADKNKKRTQKVEIPIIYMNSEFCKGDDVWSIAKSNYEARMPCQNTPLGSLRRNCTGKDWGPIISYCVNAELQDIEQKVEKLNKGIGLINNDAGELFKEIQQSTTAKTYISFANINASVLIFKAMNDVSKQQSNQWNDTIMPHFVSAISNALNDTKSWKNPETKNTYLSVTYLQTIEEMISNSNLTSNNLHDFENVKLALCNNSNGAHCSAFNASITPDNRVVFAGFRNLHEILPQNNETNGLETTILSVTTVNNATENNSITVQMNFDYAEKRLRNHEMYCVFWDVTQNMWSSKGCEWGGAQNQKLCKCKHNSAFTILMSKTAETLLYAKELTYAGLGISIVSLVLCLIIEFLVWDAVVKPGISNFRHAALVNICLCLLFAHCAFLASADPKAFAERNSQWCSTLALIKHFFFLAVFFWMLCLSVVLLHQMIFVFDQLRKKVFLVLSITVGYVCPFICVMTTFITFENGKEGEYYDKETCWLVYHGLLKGSIFSFVIPALTIVMVNLFTLVVVIMKIVTPTVSESKARDNKDVARSMIKTIVFLSPILGITWLLGILVLHLDLTQKPFAQIVGYSFTLLNSLQGFLILLTNCLGEKKVRDALQKRFRFKQSVQSKNESSLKATSSSMMK